jgi:glutamate synthase domain-containing protein 2
VLQGNIEDTRLGVQEYAIRELGVECVELKWGQGAKNIGGEVKIRSLEKAQLLHERGYIVLPDPTSPTSSRRSGAARSGSSSGTRASAWSRRKGFARRVEELRAAGAKYIFLKTGAYRPADLARAVLFSSRYGSTCSPWTAPAAAPA